ncbi:ABC transporter permease [Aminipila sp.]|uniref:ABC transporter permease n=1 Tax=Aminipila sp. TaxID=2060095 RepID=UPI002897FD09|nr:ABC transporter permease [Aminipila sp.]
MRLKDSASEAMQKYSIFFVLLVMILISAAMNDNFFSSGNLTNIGRQLAVATILAYGEMLLIISGMLDLSAGAVLALSGVLSVSFYKNTGSLLGAFLVAIAVAVACNIVNAFFVANCKMPAFIVTLAMTMAARGMALLYTQGQNILQIGDYKIFGQGRLSSVPILEKIPFVNTIPIPIIFLIMITIATWYVLNHTKFGRSLYAIGGNEEAAVASGINVIASKYKAFIINGIFVGIAGVLFMSRVNAGLPNGAIGYEMEGLTAAIVGGTSFSGGVGTTLGTLVGSFIIGCLNNIMNLQLVDSYVQQIVKGGIIVAAVLYDLKVKNKKSVRVILGNKEKKNAE